MESKLRMVISFVKNYNRLLSVSCRVGDLSLSFSCRVGDYFLSASFVCELTFGQLSVGELSHNAGIGSGLSPSTVQAGTESTNYH